MICAKSPSGSETAANADVTMKDNKPKGALLFFDMLFYLLSFDVRMVWVFGVTLPVRDYIGGLYGYGLPWPVPYLYAGCSYTASASGPPSV